MAGSTTPGADQHAPVVGKRIERDDSRDESAPQRHKRGKYTSAACDECRLKKTKCDGEKPCERCTDHGKPCIYGSTRGQARESTGAVRAAPSSVDRISLVEVELQRLRDQVDRLQASIRDLQHQNGRLPSEVQDGRAQRLNLQKSSHDFQVPRRTQVRSRAVTPTQTQFHGPTSAGFSFGIADAALNDLGLHSERNNERQDSPASNPPDSPRQPEKELSHSRDPLLALELSEIYRMLNFYKIEVTAMLPFINVDEMIRQTAEIYTRLEKADHHRQPGSTTDDHRVELLKMIVATAYAVEQNGQSIKGHQLFQSVENGLSRSIKDMVVNLAHVQLFALTALYHINCDEEVLAWRTIGIAARMALEMGLHRSESVMAKFPKANDRHLAIRVFYCIYVMDRRWSFETGMPFIIHDADIDPDLVRINGDISDPQLEGMYEYGKLSTRVWETVAGFDKKAIDPEKVSFLDFQLRQWRESLPEQIQLSLASLEAPETPESRTLHRLQTELYLSINHLRIMVHRHNILSQTSIGDGRGARLVTDIAKDTIRVLETLRKHTTMFDTQAGLFNYFLISALSAIFLAVCHAPAKFSASCSDAFFCALSLLQDLSSRTYSARRLWKSLRGLKKVAPQLGLTPVAEQALENQVAISTTRTAATTPQQLATPRSQPCNIETNSSQVNPPFSVSNELQQTWGAYDSGMSNYGNMYAGVMPDMQQMSNELTWYFEAFGEGQGQDAAQTEYTQPRPFQGQDNTEISMLFGNLL